MNLISVSYNHCHEERSAPVKISYTFVSNQGPTKKIIASVRVSLIPCYHVTDLASPFIQVIGFISVISL